MSRYDCPHCGKSLRFRLLRNVPVDVAKGGHIAFACSHCGSVLTYAEPASRLHRLTWSTPGRRILTNLAILGISMAATRFLGKVYGSVVIVLLLLFLLLPEFFSRQPAYKLLRPASSDSQRGL